MANTTSRVVIIGAGQAGAVAAQSLRSFGHEGPIVIIGDETHWPYERPELSKGYLAGTIPIEKLRILDETAGEGLNITCRLSEKVTEIDVDAQEIVTDRQSSVPFDHLIFATGGAPRTLDGWLSLRTACDADRLRSRLADVSSLAVVGGGWLGLELASHARTLGAACHVYERAPHLCARVLPQDVSQHLEAHHRDMGVHLSLGQDPDLAQITQQHDLMAACIGMVPNDRLAQSVGIAVDGGILVSATQETSVPGIYAIGDCARGHGMARIESWAYANRSAKRAAASITGTDLAQEDPLWFWSKQGTLSLQMMGRCGAGTTGSVQDTAQGGRVWRYTDAGQLCGVIAINSPRDFAKARREL